MYKQYRDTNYSICPFGNLINNKTKKLKKPEIRRNGYVYYKISINGVNKNITAHKMVYETYIGEINKSLDINHIDGNKLNNSFDNLEQVTRSENMLHAYKLGLRKPSIMERSKNAWTKYSSEDIDKAAKYVNLGISLKDFILKTNMSARTYYRLKKQMETKLLTLIN